MTEREALKLALEALEEAWYHVGTFQPTEKAIDLYDEARTAIKEALAQPVQEPVVWMYQNKSTHEVRFQKHMRSFVDHSKTSEVPLYSEPLANHELQCVCGAVWCGDEMVHLPNKAQPQRKPLTDEEIAKEFYKFEAAGAWYQFARAIEAAHGIKGEA